MHRSVIPFICLASLCGIHVGCQPTSPSESFSATASPGSSREESAGQVTQVQTQAAPVPGDQVPTDPPPVELALADLAQLEQTVKSQAGKVVVVDIWSTSCAPCMREFPHLVELSLRYPERVACVSFNVDYIGLKSKPPESYLPAAEDFLRKQSGKLTNLLSTSTDEAVLAEFKLESIPAILIYDPAGNRLHTLTDVNSGEDGLTYEGGRSSKN